MKPKIYLATLLFCLLSLCPTGLQAQVNMDNARTNVLDTDFEDRKAIINTLQNFYIGDRTGSIEHKKKSMHPKGAYRYIDRDGKYEEFVFDLESNDADTSFEEELLSIEIYSRVALARVRQIREGSDKPEYKLMVLHKAEGQWLITSISWGFGVVQ